METFIPADADIFGRSDPLPFRNYDEFVESLTEPQRRYLLDRIRRNQADLQGVVRDIACGLSVLNEIHDAAVRAVELAESLGRR